MTSLDWAGVGQAFLPARDPRSLSVTRRGSLAAQGVANQCMTSTSDTNGVQGDQSIGELVQQASQQLTELVREEIHLAQI
jgi:hypothetical protein